MQVRILRPTDAEALRALRLQSVLTDPGAFGRTLEEEQSRDVAWYAERLTAQDGSEADAVLGAFEGDLLVGIVGLLRETQVRRSHRVNLWGMYVAPEARGRGTGRALLSAALAHARAIPGVRQVHLGVTARATAARALYLAMGFTSIGRIPGGMRMDDGFVDEELMVCRVDGT